MEYFKFPEYQRDATPLLRAYAENQLAYLRRMHQTVPITTLQQFLRSEIDRSLRRPSMTMIDYPSYGDAKMATVDLLSFTEQTARRNIITPAGTVYMPPSVKTSFLKTKILNNQAHRKKQKKVMLAAAAAGDAIVEQRANYIQSSIKIETNAIPGAFGSPFNCVYDKPGYNSVTSTSRHSIMCGYAHTERMLEANFYFPTLDHCVNYAITLLRVCPRDVDQVIAEYGLHVPSVSEVMGHFINSLKYYQRITPSIRTALTRLLEVLTPGERTFVFYANCLQTIVTYNGALFQPFLKEFFRTDVTVDATVRPESIFSLNGDLLAMLSGLNADLIGRRTISEALTEDPDGIRHLIAIGRHMETTLGRLGRLISTFLRVDCDVADAMSHPAMIRKTVMVSDTDSVIFSTQSWIEWYAGSISFSRPAYEINGFVVFMLSMSLEHLFARLSASFGATGEDIHRITMKNEFLYPVMLRTPLKKTYAGRVAVQEGFVLAKLKEDIKGSSFKNSNMCRETTRAGTDFINWVFDTVMRDGSLRVSDCLEKVLDHENMVLRSLANGEPTFVTTTPIRDKGDYKLVDSSDYYYWLLWDEVFAPTFGPFIIPAKGYEIPLMGKGKVLKDERYLERVRAFDPDLHARLLGFMERNTRDITRIIMPTTLKTIPPILRPAIDARGITYANSTPFIVVMRALGVGYTDSKDQTLLSDIYTKVQADDVVAFAEAA